MGAAQKMTVFSFFIAGVLVIALTQSYDFSSSKSSMKSISGVQKTAQRFKGVSYFLFSRKGEHLRVSSDEVLGSVNSDKVQLKKPYGEISTVDGLVKYSGKRGEVFPQKSSISLYEQVKLSREGLRVLSDKLHIDQGQKIIDLVGGVKTFASNQAGDKLSIQSDTAHMEGENHVVSYKDNVKGKVRYKNKNFSPPISFSSNRLNFISKTGEINLEENISFKRGNIKLSSNFGSIFLSNGAKKGVRYFIFNEDVRFNEKFKTKAGVAVTRTGVSQKLEGFGFEKKIILSGFPKIKQLDDLIRGNKIIIRESSEIVEILNTNSKFKFKNN